MEIQKQLEGIDRKLTTIWHLLSGNELDKSSGLINKVKDIEEEQLKLERKVEKLEKLKDRVFWIFIGMGFPAGIGAWELIKNIFQS